MGSAQSLPFLGPNSTVLLTRKVKMVSLGKKIVDERGPYRTTNVCVLYRHCVQPRTPSYSPQHTNSLVTSTISSQPIRLDIDILGRL